MQICGKMRTQIKVFKDIFLPLTPVSGSASFICAWQRRILPFCFDLCFESQTNAMHWLALTIKADTLREHVTIYLHTTMVANRCRYMVEFILQLSRRAKLLLTKYWSVGNYCRIYIQFN